MAEIYLDYNASSRWGMGTMHPSHVLEAMGCFRGEARPTLRISLGWETTEAELRRFAVTIRGIVGRIRKAGAASSARATAASETVS